MSHITQITTQMTRTMIITLYMINSHSTDKLRGVSNQIINLWKKNSNNFKKKSAPTSEEIMK